MSAWALLAVAAVVVAIALAAGIIAGWCWRHEGVEADLAEAEEDARFWKNAFESVEQIREMQHNRILAMAEWEVRLHQPVPAELPELPPPPPEDDGGWWEITQRLIEDGIRWADTL